MTSTREWIKRVAPRSARRAFVDIRQRFEAPPLEEIVLHPYAVRCAPGMRLRISLVLPSLAADKVFGGVATGVEIFLQFRGRTGADLRILLDDFDRTHDRNFIENAARKAGVDPGCVEIQFRSAAIEPIDVRASDLFFAFNWWTALNLRAVVGRQRELFGGQRPLLYLIQEYEPQFYPLSSTHLFARAAFDSRERTWGIFNSSQLHTYFRGQGHVFEREYVFEPRLSDSLRPFLDVGPTSKQKRILVYGRPNIPRNCFPAIVMGLREWVETYPQYSDWTVTSAGVAHQPVPIGRGRAMTSLGKLALEDYANLLRTTAVGVSLMSSPHPSYPPLEMAHFGVRTITNRYFCKDLSSAHDNIVSLFDIGPRTIAHALAEACSRVEESPNAGWRGRSHVPEYLAEDPYPFLEHLAADIAAELTEKRLAETGPL